MAKKARSAAQKAATKRMLAAAAARRAGKDEELEENPKMAKKKPKKSKAKKAKAKSKKAGKKATKRAAVKKGGKKTKRKKKAAPRAGIPVVAGPGPAPKKRRKKAKKAKAKAKAKRAKTRKASKPRKKTRAKTTRTQGKAHIIKLKGAPKVQYVEVVEKKKRTKKRKKKMMENPASLALAAPSSGTFGGLFENPAGPFTKDSMVSFVWAASGTALGLTIARLTDRAVATRKPSDSKNGTKGKHPWLGRDAAAMINRRPDAIRLGVQGVGALAAMVGAYTARNVRVLPWALGGIALGFGSNLLVMVMEWLVLPKILKVDPKDPKTATEGLGGLGNRLLPMEQEYVQDDLDKQLEDWALIANLAAAQAGEKPTAASPLALPSNVYTLGEGQGGPQNPLSQAVGGLIPTGRVGECVSCGGQGGCYSGCPEVQNCGPCSEGGSGTDDGGQTCGYVVQEGDDLQTLLDATGTTFDEIAALNGGLPPDEIWRPGREVVLPYKACVEIVRRLPPPVRQRIPERPPVITREPTPDIPVREPTPDIPVREPSIPVRVPTNTTTLVRANLPGAYVPPVVAGAPVDSDAEKERRLRNVGRDDND